MGKGSASERQWYGILGNATLAILPIKNQAHIADPLPIASRYGEGLKGYRHSLRSKQKIRGMACVATWSFGLEAVETATRGIKAGNNCIDILENAINGMKF